MFLVFGNGFGQFVESVAVADTTGMIERRSGAGCAVGTAFIHAGKEICQFSRSCFYDQTLHRKCRFTAEFPAVWDCDFLTLGTR